jgi:uncharacterized protein with beta-barrel porin domain
MHSRSMLERRRLLLRNTTARTSLALLALAGGLAAAQAEGGLGSTYSGGSRGLGGVDNVAGGAGAPGQTASAHANSGHGGGGAGVAGGKGGGTLGGAGGTGPGNEAGHGSMGADGAGGGGGGYIGTYLGGPEVTFTATGTIAGGRGGNGAGSGKLESVAGGGGAGGIGMLVTAPALSTLVIDGSTVVIGGHGGKGGNEGIVSYGYGVGGTGGAGLMLNGQSARVAIDIRAGAKVAGGDGGAAGREGSVYWGRAGEGIVGDKLDITIAGTVSGGSVGDRSNRNLTGGHAIVGSDISIKLVGNGAIGGGRLDRTDSVRVAITFKGGNNSIEFGGATSNITGDIMVGGTETVTLKPAAGGTTLSNRLRGGTAIVKAGTGKLTLTSAATSGFTGWARVEEGVLELASGAYIGGVQVNGGGLAVNGSAGNVTVNGGFLGGIGKVGPTQIMSGAALAPGNSIGTLTVNGALTFATGSRFEVEVSPDAADRVDVVGGAATLTGATVVTTYEPGTYIAKRYTILNAENGLGGTRFAGVKGKTPVGFDQSLAYDDKNAYLELSLQMAGGGNGGNNGGANNGGGNGGGGNGGGSKAGDSGTSGSSGGTGESPGGGASAGGSSSFANLAPNARGVADAIVSYFETTGVIPAVFGALTPEGLAASTGETGTGAQQAGTSFSSEFISAIGGPEMGGVGDASGVTSGPAAYAPIRPSPAAERFGRLSYAAEELAGGTDASTRAVRLQHKLDRGFADEAPSARAERFSVWGAALGGGMAIAANAATGAQSVSGSVIGLASGFDYSNAASGGGTRAGLALGASWSSSTVDGGLGSANVGNFSAGLRASHDFGRLYLAGAFAYGLHAATTARGFAGETYSAAFLGQSISARAEAGWRFRTAAVDLSPFVAGRIVSFSTPAYTETGSGAGTFALAYGAATSVEARSEIGLRLNRTVSHASGGATTFSGMAGWAHYFSRGRTVTAGFATLPGTQFVTQGAAGASDTALISLGVSHRFATGLGLALNADGELGAGTVGYGAKGKLSWNW